jgi:aminoglycoside phosphotransferase
MLRSLRSGMNPQYGEAYAQRFLDAYGRDHLSDEGLRAHDLLEQFFWPVPPTEGSRPDT